MIGSLGISNCYDSTVLQRIYSTAIVKPCVLQNRFYADTEYDREIRAYLRALPGSPIEYQSFWTLTANLDVVNSPVVDRIASHLDITNEQVHFDNSNVLIL